MSHCGYILPAFHLLIDPVRSAPQVCVSSCQPHMQHQSSSGLWGVTKKFLPQTNGELHSYVHVAGAGSNVWESVFQVTSCNLQNYKCFRDHWSLWLPSKSSTMSQTAMIPIKRSTMNQSYNIKDRHVMRVLFWLIHRDQTAVLRWKIPESPRLKKVCLVRSAAKEHVSDFHCQVLL